MPAASQVITSYPVEIIKILWRETAIRVTRSQEQYIHSIFFHIIEFSVLLTEIICQILFSLEPQDTAGPYNDRSYEHAEYHGLQYSGGFPPHLFRILRI